MEKQKLLEEKLSKEVILTKLARYFGLLDEMRQLEESANDPSRLTGRGQRGDPGRLLREEKQRKRVAKEKPKVSEAFPLSYKLDINPSEISQLESDLMRSIPDWEEQHGQAFMVSGSRLLEDLSAKVESEQLTRPPSRVSHSVAQIGCFC
jgi:protein regulator of cytokinesis 1